MVIKSDRTEVGILGAGIMGCCLALELAHRGYRVDLIELASAPMTAASLHNEGKLHLSFVYAKDPLKATHGLMVRGSLAFARILEQLTGCGAEALIPSQPFHYFVPIDSQLDMAAIWHHFQAVEAAIHAVSRNTGDLYLGRRLERFHERNSTSVHSRLFSPGLTLGSFKTEELSVSPVAVAAILCAAIKKESKITFIGNTEILAVERLANGEVEIESRQGGKVSLNRVACVANCLWEAKPRIDTSAGIPDHGPWIMRYKLTINISAPMATTGNIPSATGILGAYGDLVNQGSGLYYVSWYPLCKIAQSINGDERKLRDMIHTWVLPRAIKKVTSRTPAISKFIASITHRKFIDDNIAEMAAYIPSLGSLLNNKRTCELGGGVILARGATNIDDPESSLHQRSGIGPAAYGSYVTIDTGKYCMAPLFASEAADMITNVLK